VIEPFVDRYVYVLIVVLLGLGLFGIFAHRHLVKKVIALVIFQTGIYLFYIEGSIKSGASVPIIAEELGEQAAAYVNPLPHLLILTALVVGVGVVGVALALLLRIHRACGSLNEDEVVDKLSG